MDQPTKTQTWWLRAELNALIEPPRGRPAAGRYGVTVTTVNMPALKWPGMLQTKR